MNSPLDNVYELLRLEYGDAYRLEDIKQRLENGKILFTSDNDYLQKLVYRHSGEIQKVVEHKNSIPKYIPTPEPKYIPTPEPKYIPTPEPKYIPTPEPKYIPTPEPKYIPTPEPKLSQKKSSKKKKLVIVFGVFVLLYFVFSVLGGGENMTSSKIVNERNVLSEEEYKELAIPWTYNDIVRNPEKYYGKILLIEGAVEYVSERGGDRYWLAIKTQCGSGLEQLICKYVVVDYSGKRILEGDKIQSYGELSEKISPWPKGTPAPVIKSDFLECFNCN